MILVGSIDVELEDVEFSQTHIVRVEVFVVFIHITSCYKTWMCVFILNFYMSEHILVWVSTGIGGLSNFGCGRW